MKEKRFDFAITIFFVVLFACVLGIAWKIYCAVTDKRITNQIVNDSVIINQSDETSFERLHLIGNLLENHHPVLKNLNDEATWEECRWFSSEKTIFREGEASPMEQSVEAHLIEITLKKKPPLLYSSRWLESDENIVFVRLLPTDKECTPQTPRPVNYKSRNPLHENYVLNGPGFLLFIPREENYIFFFVLNQDSSTEWKIKRGQMSISFEGIEFYLKDK